MNKAYVLNCIFHSDFKYLRSYKLSKTYFTQFCWNHDKLFQRFIETAAIASLRCWNMQMLIWCFGGGILRQKTILFRNNAEESKRTALNDNSKNAQAAQCPAVRWSSCEITVMAELYKFVWKYLRPLLSRYSPPLEQVASFTVISNS